MKAVLDTDIVSELLKRANETVRARAVEYRRQQGPLSVSAVTVLEIVDGWHRVGRPERAREALRRLGDTKVLPLDAEVAVIAGEISAALNQRGAVIGFADICIAATALRHRRVLVTGNTAHFERVTAAGFPLTLEDWRRGTSTT